MKSVSNDTLSVVERIGLSSTSPPESVGFGAPSVVVWSPPLLLLLLADVVAPDCVGLLLDGVVESLLLELGAAVVVTGSTSVVVATVVVVGAIVVV